MNHPSEVAQEEDALATIGDVARLAGVSRSTVSYALSGKRPISARVRHKLGHRELILASQPEHVVSRIGVAGSDEPHVVRLISPELVERGSTGAPGRRVST